MNTMGKGTSHHAHDLHISIFSLHPIMSVENLGRPFFHTGDGLVNLTKNVRLHFRIRGHKRVCRVLRVPWLSNDKRVDDRISGGSRLSKRIGHNYSSFYAPLSISCSSSEVQRGSDAEGAEREQG